MGFYVTFINKRNFSSFSFRQVAAKGINQRFVRMRKAEGKARDEIMFESASNTVQRSLLNAGQCRHFVMHFLSGYLGRHYAETVYCNAVLPLVSCRGVFHRAARRLTD